MGVERTQQIAAEVAELMGIPEYTITVLDRETGDTSVPGTAYTAPYSREITVAWSTANLLTDDELRDTLAHEFAHIMLGDPPALRVSRKLRLREVSITLGTLFGIVLGSVTLTPDTWPWLQILLSGLVGAITGGFTFVIWRDLQIRKLEFSCDIEAAHAVGAQGLSAFRFDPSNKLGWFDRLVADHPPAEIRMMAKLQHQMRRACGCPPRAVRW